MKKVSLIIVVLLILNIICSVFLFAKYLEFKPILNDLKESYMIEVKKQSN